MTTTSDFLSQLGSLQDRKAYAELHWDGSFEEYLGLARTFWSSYLTELQTDGEHEPAWLSSEDRSPSFDGQCVRHLAACLLARIDGKSRVDYLTQDWHAPLIRELCRDCLRGTYGSIVEVFEQLEQRLRTTRLWNEHDQHG